MEQKKVLIIQAHQVYKGIAEGKLNDTLANLTDSFFNSENYSVVHTVLERGYDIETEIDKVLNTDLVIIHTPVYCFNAPWLFKKYTDEVFLQGMINHKLLDGDGRTRENPKKQYGTGGKLYGKKVAIIATWNAPEESFNDINQVLLEGKSADDVLLNISLNYKFCGMEVLPYLHCFDVMKNPNVDLYVKNLKNYLTTITNLN
jgi:NADPH dehydrogenase (quinone)